MKLFKKQNRFQKSSEAVSAIETLIKSKLMKVNVNTYEVKLSKELCWAGKNEKWRTNMLKNLHLYIGLKRALHNKEHKELPLKILDITTGEIMRITKM